MTTPDSSMIKLRPEFRRPLLAVLLGAVLLGNSACDKKPASTAESPAPEENAMPTLARNALAEKPAPPTTAQATPAASRAPAAAAAPAKTSAPAGGAVHYVIKRVSITTDDGIQNLPLGTPVQIVAQTNLDARIQLADGTQLTVTADQITADANLARQFVAADQVGRRPIAVANTAPQGAPRAAPAGAVAAASPQSAPVAQATPPVWHPMTGTSLDQKAQPTSTVVNPPKKKK